MRDLDVRLLLGLHFDLIKVVETASKECNFLVAEGLRTKARQEQLYKEGRSKTLNSRHLTGHAVDLYPIINKPIPKMTMADMKPVVDAMRRAAKALSIEMEHGYDWGWDPAHHELKKSKYP